MPKIVVREFDKTKAGIPAYKNFSVVIPGLVKERAVVNASRDTGIGEWRYGGFKPCSSEITEDK
jgi:hypothetical protein